MEWAVWVGAAYLLGAVPSGVLVARAMGGRDPRSAGSGNIGATNVGRVLGRKAGILTLVLDVLKGLLPALLAAHFLKPSWQPCAVGFAAFAGHCFPVYLNFRGGKGVATGAGIMAALAPAALAGSLLVFVLTLWRWRMVGLSSVAASAALPLAAWFATPLESRMAVTVLAVGVGVVSIVKHRGNLARIRAGTEPKLGQRA